MRARYVNSEELLTPLGNWIAARLPDVEFRRNIWGGCGKLILRVYGGKPFYRGCLFSFTWTNFSAGHAGRDSINLSILGRKIFYRPGSTGRLP
jgi:hypothetical protein